MNRPEGFPRNHADLSPLEGARLLAAFVDELIPGAENWPSASIAGVHGIVAVRICDASGQGDLSDLLDAILAAGGLTESGSPEERASVVAKIETANNALFERVRAAVVLAYYETPFVTQAIRRLGRPYESRPHIAGYPMRPFDPARDTPGHNRGSYISTNDVRPVDTSGLNLDRTHTKRWGIER